MGWTVPQRWLFAKSELKNAAPLGMFFSQEYLVSVVDDEGFHSVVDLAEYLNSVFAVIEYVSLDSCPVRVGAIQIEAQFLNVVLYCWS